MKIDFNYQGPKPAGRQAEVVVPAEHLVVAPPSTHATTPVAVSPETTAVPPLPADQVAAMGERVPEGAREVGPFAAAGEYNLKGGWVLKLSTDALVLTPASLIEGKPRQSSITTMVQNGAARVLVIIASLDQPDEVDDSAAPLTIESEPAAETGAEDASMGEKS
jgi:hypothetical protein